MSTGKPIEFDETSDVFPTEFHSLGWSPFLQGQRLLWDRVGRAAVFYYGAAFAAVGSFGLLLLIPGDDDQQKVAVQ
jgi:hypothetical protein